MEINGRLDSNDFNTSIQIKEDDNIGIGLKKQECMLSIMSNIDDKPSLDQGQYWIRISGSTYYVRIFKKPNFIKRFFMNKLLGLEFYEAKE